MPDLKAPHDVTEAELLGVVALVNANTASTAAEVAEYERRLTAPDYPLLNRLTDILYIRRVIP